MQHGVAGLGEGSVATVDDLITTVGNEDLSASDAVMARKRGTQRLTVWVWILAQLRGGLPHSGGHTRRRRQRRLVRVELDPFAIGGRLLARNIAGTTAERESSKPRHSL